MRHALLTMALLAAAAQATAAQGGLIVYGQGGGVWPVVPLHEDGDDFRESWSYGAGAALAVSGFVALRASVTRTSTEYRGTRIALTDDHQRRTYLAGDLQIGFPAYSAWVPYVVLGGGLVRTEPADATQSDVTSPMGRLGLGVNRIGGFFIWFAEATVAGYQFEGLGFKRLQVDPQVSIGLALGIPF